MPHRKNPRGAHRNRHLEIMEAFHFHFPSPEKSAMCLRNCWLLSSPATEANSDTPPACLTRSPQAAPRRLPFNHLSLRSPSPRGSPCAHGSPRLGRALERRGQHRVHHLRGPRQHRPERRAIGLSGQPGRFSRPGKREVFVIGSRRST